MNIIQHPESDFVAMRKAGRLAAEILDFITDYIEPGVNTEKLNTLCHNKIIENNAVPAPLNYKGFPKSICTSKNNIICHGIPSEKDILQDGDILNIDVTVILDGWHGDSSRMYFVGQPKHKAQKLCDITYDCMMKGINAVKPGVKICEIGKAIAEYAHSNAFSVVEDFCGHGIGTVFHTDPNVLHYYNSSYDVTLEEGMFFTVEPMINTGTHRMKLLDDGWTSVTRDGKLSAQFEHTIAVTNNGYEIFTLSPKGFSKPPY